jgi:hypothetical protein
MHINLLDSPQYIVFVGVFFLFFPLLGRLCMLHSIIVKRLPILARTPSLHSVCSFHSPLAHTRLVSIAQSALALRCCLRSFGTTPTFNMPFTEFKNDIARQLSALAGVEPSLVLEAIETPRSPEHGDFAVAIPRLRLKGNPVALAKEFADKVSILY